MTVDLIAPDHPVHAMLAEADAIEASWAEQSTVTIEPLRIESQSANPFRPHAIADIIGQTRAKRLVTSAIVASLRDDTPLDHVLLVGASGTGKTTFATAIANELQVDVYAVEAPVSHETLLALREVMLEGDVLFIDEIHQQGVMERRGKEGSTQPEVLFSVMEDRTIATATGVLPFPPITVIGATTDEGRLPDAFVNRFPLRPFLEPYEERDLIVMAKSNAKVIGRTLTHGAARAIARACRGVPREVNNLVRNAALHPVEPIPQSAVLETLDLNGVTRDGLTRDMQTMLRFLYQKGKRKVKGETRYQASVNTIATGIGKSRDSKAVSLRVEPYLIECGFVQVAHGGRVLTDAGVKRAKELCR